MTNKSPSKDLRWIQRFNNFKKAFSKLTNAVQKAKASPLSELEKQGLIQGFEYTHELAWNVLKDYIEYQGGQALIGSKDTTREAFQKGLISNGEAWMEMITSRNLTTHTYNEATADLIYQNIIQRYYDCFIQFDHKMESLKP